jgi:hypothetical protein
MSIIANKKRKIFGISFREKLNLLLITIFRFFGFSLFINAVLTTKHSTFS